MICGNMNTQLHAWWTAPIIAIHFHLIKHQQIHVKLIRNRNRCFCFELDEKIASDGPHIVLSNTPSSAFSPALESFPDFFPRKVSCRDKSKRTLSRGCEWHVTDSFTFPVISILQWVPTGECKCFCQPCHPRGADRVAVSCFERKIGEIIDWNQAEVQAVKIKLFFARNITVPISRCFVEISRAQCRLGRRINQPQTVKSQLKTRSLLR